MASDQLVSARVVLRAVMTLRRVGTSRAMAELERVEPDLASYMMEEFSLVHRDLLALRGPPRRTQRLQDRVQALALTCVAAMREAHYELWHQDAAGTPLAGLDPDAETGDGDDAAEDGGAGTEEPPPPAIGSG